MKIEKLTPEQEARFAEFRDKWIRIGLCTDPADRKMAEEGIIEAYRIAGFQPPKIAWCSSPMAMGLTRAVVLESMKDKLAGKKIKNSVWDSVGDSVRASVGDSVEDSVEDSVWASVRASVGDSVGDSVWASVRDSVRASVWDSVEASVEDSVRASVRASVEDSVWASVRTSVRASVGDSVWASVRDSGYGQHDANWLAFYEYFKEVCGLAEETKKLSGLWKIAKSAGWWLPHEKICWVSERTCVVNQDENKRIHSSTGPAIAYPDGWSIYAWRGVRVPEQWIMRPESVNPVDVIAAKNVEQRAAGAEILGWPRMLKALNAKVIDDSGNEDIGQLIELSLPGLPEPGRFLKARCPRNGVIVEGVPRVSDIDGKEIRTALHAQAWRIGDSIDDYIHPPRRT